MRGELSGSEMKLVMTTEGVETSKSMPWPDDVLGPYAQERMVRKHASRGGDEFEMKIQGHALGRILASKTIKAFRKDVTGHLYGGDYTRKMKLLEKKKKGKKKMQDRGKATIPHDVFLKMMRK